MVLMAYSSGDHFALWIRTMSWPELLALVLAAVLLAFVFLVLGYSWGREDSGGLVPQDDAQPHARRCAPPLLVAETTCSNPTCPACRRGR